MTVFVAHAPADREAAESLERYIERRGHFVELDDGQTALRPIAPTDVLVLLNSRQLLAAPERTRLEQRCYDAWAANRLVIARLDEAEPPVGLRDLPSVQREGEDWPAAVQAVQQALSRAAKPAPQGGRAGLGAWLPVIGLTAGVLAGLAAFWVIAAIWLVNRIGPTPGGWPELRAGLDAFALRFGVPFGAALIPGIVAAGLICAGSLAMRFARARRTAGRSTVVLYADADKTRLAGLIGGARRVKVRLVEPAALDFKGLADLMAGTSRCVVFCSTAAFASDALKRALYAADRAGVKPIPVYVSNESPPQDFVHFLAGSGGVRLYELPEPEMAQAFLRALGAHE